jgi:hypothetical protein
MAFVASKQKSLEKNRTKNKKNNLVFLLVIFLLVEPVSCYPILREPLKKTLKILSDRYVESRGKR